MASNDVHSGGMRMNKYIRYQCSEDIEFRAQGCLLSLQKRKDDMLFKMIRMHS